MADPALPAHRREHRPLALPVLHHRREAAARSHVDRAGRDRRRT
jgi:hypothetical protein